MEWTLGEQNGDGNVLDVTKETTVNEQEEEWGRAEGGQVAGPRPLERFGFSL